MVVTVKEVVFRKVVGGIGQSYEKVVILKPSPDGQVALTKEGSWITINEGERFPDEVLHDHKLNQISGGIRNDRK